MGARTFDNAVSKVFHHFSEIHDKTVFHGLYRIPQASMLKFQTTDHILTQDGHHAVIVVSVSSPLSWWSLIIKQRINNRSGGLIIVQQTPLTKAKDILAAFKKILTEDTEFLQIVVENIVDFFQIKFD